MRRLVYLSLFGLAACDGGDGGSAIPADQLGTEWGSLMCNRFAACCTVEELRQEILASGEAECREMFSVLAGETTTRILEDSIASGRVAYDGERMADCFATIRAQPCDQLNAFEIWAAARLLRCEGVFEPQVATGGACAFDWDCQSHFCIDATIDPEDNLVLGMCLEPPAIDTRCIRFRCGEGAWCDGDTDMPRCHAILEDGAACTDGYQCEGGGCTGGVCGAPTVCDGVD